VISLSNISVRFERTTALASLCIKLAAGTSTAVIGPNGSGKTTLLHVLAGLTKPTAGVIDFTSALSTALVTQHRIGKHWLPLTVREVISMGTFARRALFSRASQADRDAITEAAQRLEVDGLLDLSYGDLSGGEQQRVNVAQALAQRAELLLLDEPITGLDLASQQRILAIIEEEKQRGSTVVLSTHHLDEARHADQIVLLSTRAIAAGSPDHVLTEANLRAAYGNRVLSPREGEEMTVLDDHGHGH